MLCILSFSKCGRIDSVLPAVNAISRSHHLGELTLFEHLIQRVDQTHLGPTFAGVGKPEVSEHVGDATGDRFSAFSISARHEVADDYPCSGKSSNSPVRVVTRRDRRDSPTLTVSARPVGGEGGRASGRNAHARSVAATISVVPTTPPAADVAGVVR